MKYKKKKSVSSARWVHDLIYEKEQKRKEKSEKLKRASKKAQTCIITSFFRQDSSRNKTIVQQKKRFMRCNVYTQYQKFGVFGSLPI